MLLKYLQSNEIIVNSLNTLPKVCTSKLSHSIALIALFSQIKRWYQSRLTRGFLRFAYNCC
ncbi:GM19456 [Drosophila sechellia]|uniref:GM19456 n=1 Tax=Drosophila sechellia TaxID=7238 RepID=B4IGF4_DROSE|nr:GM19456 [Drosophila sechellia]